MKQLIIGNNLPVLPDGSVELNVNVSLGIRYATLPVHVKH